MNKMGFRRIATHTFFGMMFLSMLLMFGCAKDQVVVDQTCKAENNRICVVYEQTKCADVWNNGSSEAQTIQNLKDFYMDLDVVLHNVRMDNGGTLELCKACDCKTGKRFLAEVEIKDVDLVLKNGFVKR